MVAITMPSTARLVAGATVVRSVEELEINLTGAACDRATICTRVPDTFPILGSYIIDAEASRRVGRNVGAETTQLPVHAVYRPLLRSTVRYADAAGLPLRAVRSDVVTVTTTSGSGPGGSPARGFVLSLAAGRYERMVLPDAPFDDAFPPKIDIVNVNGRQTEEIALVASRVVDFPFTITSQRISLEGFTAVLLDAASHNPVSSRVPLHAGVNQVRLHTVDRDVTRPDGLVLVVAPPDGVALPSLEVESVAQTLPALETYPAIPDPPLVRGRILACSVVGGLPSILDAGTGAPTGCRPPPGRIGATLLFRAVTLEASEQNVPLRYRFRVRSDESGAFVARLPAGHYEVDVIPDADADFAATARVPFDVAITPEQQAGKSLAVGPLRTIRGRARLKDGRPVAGGMVWVRPTLDVAPGAIPPELLRAQSVTLSADGAFEMRLSPGVYDLIVQPAEGSGFPWAVVVAFTINSGGDGGPLELGDIQVPLPRRREFTLLDPSGKPVRRGIVQAFRIPPGRTDYVPIGFTLTDGRGRFRLDLADFVPSPERR